MSLLSWTNLLILIILTISDLSAKLPNKKKIYQWQETDEWSACSQTCDPGVQQKKNICIEKSLYSEQLVSENMCKDSPSLTPVTRECNAGFCKNRYFWKPGKWSDCSQTCGASGRKSRDIDCVYDEGFGSTEISDFKNCNISLKPASSSPCNILDCPLIYVPGEWGKCIQKYECKPGTQRRQLNCVAILKTGKIKAMPRHACARTQTSPVARQNCDEPMNTKECVEKNQASPVIKTKNGTLIQMRKTKLLTIGVGQVSYVLLYTKILINCPVTYYVSQDIVWKHETDTYKYRGKSKERIWVDKKGRLRIRKLQLVDQGIWTCMAGQKSASTILKLRNPSIGYQDWTIRTVLFNKEMMNEDPKSGINWYEEMQWIKKPWSLCSVSCGGSGIQTRIVQCEKIDKHYYTILKDEECIKKGYTKPETTQICQMASQCPKWSLIDADQNNCTDKCLRIGYAQIQGQLYCVHQGKEIDFNACNKKEKPAIECENEQCQVAWKKSNWSKCSKSCGGQGIMARYLICVWKNTGDPAGSLCYNQNLQLPKVIKICQSPKCNLKCVDLSHSCNSKKRRCNIFTYRYICCKTCSATNSDSKMQADESSNKPKPFEQVKQKNNKNKRTRKIKNPYKIQIKNRVIPFEKYNEIRNLIKSNDSSVKGTTHSSLSDKPNNFTKITTSRLYNNTS